MQDFFREYHKHYYRSWNNFSLRFLYDRFLLTVSLTRTKDVKLMLDGWDIDEFTEARIIEQIKETYVDRYDERGKTRVVLPISCEESE